MRTDQWIGLNERALALVKGEPVLVCVEEVVRVFPDGRRERMSDREVFVSSVKREPSGEVVKAVFGSEPFGLDKFTLPDGTCLFERLQAEPWSSGPCFFTALQRADGTWVQESRWSEDEIEEQS